MRLPRPRAGQSHHRCLLPAGRRKRYNAMAAMRIKPVAVARNGQKNGSKEAKKKWMEMEGSREGSRKRKHDDKLYQKQDGFMPVPTVGNQRLEKCPYISITGTPHKQ